jgi:hypothetical protein
MARPAEPYSINDGPFREFAMTREMLDSRRTNSSPRRHCDLAEEEATMSKIRIVLRSAIGLSVVIAVVQALGILLATPAWSRGGHSAGPAHGASGKPVTTARAPASGRITPYQYTPPAATVSPHGPPGTASAAAGPALASVSGLSNICATRSGSCPMRRQVGTPCQCKDTQGRVFDGIAR